MRTVFTVSLIQLALFPQASHGFVSISDGLACDTIVPQNSSSFEVCSMAYFEGPSIAVVDNNGTVNTTYHGDYINDYLIYRSFPNATGTQVDDVAKEYNAGYKVRIERNDTSDKCLGVWINKLSCKSCAFCGNETYSADCTNLPFGRQATCENATLVFFPLTADALEVQTVAEPPPVPDDKINIPTSGSNEPASSSIQHHRNAGFFVLIALLVITVPVMSIMS